MNIDQHVASILTQIKALPLDQRRSVLKKALELSTKPPPKLVIKRDNHPDTSGRDSCDNLGHMACWHRRYNLGDEQPKESPDEWIKGLPEGTITLPLYLYDHSGITMSTEPFQCPWDSGRVGIIAATPEAIRGAFGELTERTFARTKKILEEEVKDYDFHLQGEVWGYEYGDDSCWGFVGDSLSYTGLEGSIPEEALDQLEDAWEARS